MKALSIRLDSHLSREFDTICKEYGYKKNGIVVRLIEAFVSSRQSQKKSKKNEKSDPFLDVIGLYEGIVPSHSSQEIDQLVYHI